MPKAIELVINMGILLAFGDVVKEKNKTKEKHSYFKHFKCWSC